MFHIARSEKKGARDLLVFVDNCDDPQYLALCDILIYFKTWEELQVSCALGGYWNWDGSLEDNDYRRLHMDSKTVREFRDFVLKNDYDPKNQKFIPRNLPIPRITDDQKAKLIAP